MRYLEKNNNNKKLKKDDRKRRRRSTHQQSCMMIPQQTLKDFLELINVNKEQVYSCINGESVLIMLDT
jgi:hypothetical protein